MRPGRRLHPVALADWAETIDDRRPALVKVIFEDKERLVVGLCGSPATESGFAAPKLLTKEDERGATRRRSFGRRSWRRCADRVRCGARGTAHGVPAREFGSDRRERPV